MLLTVQQVAERLQVSPSCVYQLIESARLPHHRSGNRRGTIRVSEDDLAAFLHTCRQDSQDQKQPEPRPRRSKLKHLKL